MGAPQGAPGESRSTSRQDLQSVVALLRGDGSIREDERGASAGHGIAEPHPLGGGEVGFVFDLIGLASECRPSESELAADDASGKPGNGARHLGAGAENSQAEEAGR